MRHDISEYVCMTTHRISPIWDVTRDHDDDAVGVCTLHVHGFDNTTRMWVRDDMTLATQRDMIIDNIADIVGVDDIDNIADMMCRALHTTRNDHNVPCYDIDSDRFGDL